MDTDLFANPIRPHVDAWEVILVLGAGLGIVAGLLGKWRQRRLWQHHAFRLQVEGYILGAAVAAGLYLAIAATAHGLAWQVWGTTAFALPGLVVVTATVVAWRWSFLPMLRKYEATDPGLATPGLKRRPGAVLRGAEFPLFVALGSGLLAYTAFLWHPWPHAFHMGMWFVAPLIGYAVASLVASQTVDVVRWERSLRATRGRRASKRPGRR